MSALVRTPATDAGKSLPAPASRTGNTTRPAQTNSKITSPCSHPAPQNGFALSDGTRRFLYTPAATRLCPTDTRLHASGAFTPPPRKTKVLTVFSKLPTVFSKVLTVFPKVLSVFTHRPAIHPKTGKGCTSMHFIFPQPATEKERMRAPETSAQPGHASAPTQRTNAPRASAETVSLMAEKQEFPRRKGAKSFAFFCRTT